MIKKIIFAILISCVIFIISAEFIFRKSQFFKEFYQNTIDPEPYTDTLNEQGLRVVSKDIIYKGSHNNGFRIICLGDSYTYGHGVDDDKTYPFFLEKYLNGISKRRFQVINAGDPGATITEELYMYIKNCAGLEHDVVLLLFHPGDLRDITRELLFQKRGDYCNVTGFDSSLNESKIFRLIKHRILKNRQKYINRYHGKWRSIEEIAEEYFNRLSILNKSVESNNATLAVVIFSPSVSGQMVKRFCSRQGIALIDVRQEYSRAKKYKEHYIVYHHNATGNALLAEIIARRMIDGGIIERE